MASFYTGRKRVVEATGSFSLFGRATVDGTSAGFISVSSGSNTATQATTAITLYAIVTGTVPSITLEWGVNYSGGTILVGSAPAVHGMIVDFTVTGSTLYHYACAEVFEFTSDGVLRWYEVADPDAETYVEQTIDIGGGATHHTTIHAASPGAAPGSRSLIAPVISCTAGGLVSGDFTSGATTFPGIGLTTVFDEHFVSGMSGPLTSLSWSEAVTTGIAGSYGTTTLPKPPAGERYRGSGAAGGKSRHTISVAGQAWQWSLPAQEDHPAIIRFGGFPYGVGSGGVDVPVTALASASGSFPATSKVFGGYALNWQAFRTPSGGVEAPTGSGLVTDYLAGEDNSFNPTAFVYMDGEDVATTDFQHWRTHFTAGAEDILTIEQAPSALFAPLPYTVTTGTTAEAWIRDNFAQLSGTTITGDGYLRLVSTAPAATYRGAYLNRPVGGGVTDSGTYGAGAFTGRNLYGYRHYRVRMRSVGSANVLVGVAASPNGLQGYLNLTTGADGEWVEREFDLADLPDFTTDGPYTPVILFGSPGFIAVRATLRFAIPGGTTVEIAEITGFRRYWTRATVMKPDRSAPGTGAVGMAMLHAWTDGLPSLQVMHLASNSPGAAARTIADMATFINTTLPDWRGWSATLLTPPADSVVTSATQGVHLEGGGTKPGGLMVVDQDATSEGGGLTLQAIPHGYAVSLYYGAGDVMGSGLYGASSSLAYVAQVGAQVVGQMLGDSASLKLIRDSDSADAGGVPEESNTRWFASDAPYMTSQYAESPERGHTASTLPAGGLSVFNPPAATHPFPMFLNGQSWRSRRVIRWINPYGDSLTGDISDTLRMVRGVVKGGEIVLQFASLQDGSGVWESQVTGITGTQPTVRYAHGRPGAPIVLVYIEAVGGAIERRQSVNEGGTWSVALTVFSAGTRPTVAVSPTGVEHFFVRTAGGAIQTRVFDPGGTQVIALTTVVASSVADDTLAAIWRAGRVFLLYRDTLGTIKTVSSADGVTFA